MGTAPVPVAMFAHQTVLQLVLYAEGLKRHRLILRTGILPEEWVRQSCFCCQPVHWVKGQDLLQEICGWEWKWKSRLIKTGLMIVWMIWITEKHFTGICLLMSVLFLTFLLHLRKKLLQWSPDLPVVVDVRRHDSQQLLPVLLPNHWHSVQN